MSLYDLFPPEFFKLSVPLSAYLILSAILFTIGVATFLFRRNVITVFMAIELMLNAVNLTFINFIWVNKSSLRIPMLLLNRV